MPENYNDITANAEVRDLLSRAMKEDVGNGDHSSLSCIDADRISTAHLIFKDKGVAAGLSIAYYILKTNDPDCKIKPIKSDGEKVDFGDIGFEVEGNARALLRSERLLLNVMQRLSGIATISEQASSLVRPYGSRVLDTRKTTPNLRILEKWAVSVGGAFNHRFGLYDMIMLKDNHIDVAGGIKPAIQKAKKYLEENNMNLGIEVETRNIEEVQEVLDSLPVQRVMLDNFTPELVRQAVELIAGRCETEASGGITLSNIEEYAKAGVDFISLGMLTHSVKSMDISFKIK